MKLAFSVAWVVAASIVLGILSLILLATQSRLAYLFTGLLIISSITALLSGRLAVQLFTAKQRAISGQSVSLLFGFAKLIVWEQNEGLMLLRDKKISEVIDGTKQGGGLRMIYPFLGEELRVRVPLTLQLTWFEDERILTREAVQLTVKVAIWWQVRSLEEFYYKIDREVHTMTDSKTPSAHVYTSSGNVPRGQLGIAEVWIRTLTESGLRQIISNTSTFLIVSKRASSGLPSDMSADLPSEAHGALAGFGQPTPATPDVIAKQLQESLQPRVTEYGLRIDRVEIQEVQLPATIQRAVDDVWVASTQPKKAGYEAEALRQRLKVACDMLGPQAAAIMEIADKLPSGSYYGNPLATLQGLLAQPGGTVPDSAKPVAKEVGRARPIGKRSNRPKDEL